MVEPWTDEEKRQIVADYARDGVAYCPSDGEVLETGRLRRLGGTRDAVVFRCPTCGRAGSSSDVT